jgi:acetate kinase
MREILARAADGDARAELARETYLHRLRGSVAAMSAAMGGVDAIVFTGGVGENSAEIRGRSMDGLAFLGVAVDPRLNASGSADREIGAPGAAVRTLVISAREDLEIARQVRELLTAVPHGAAASDARTEAAGHPGITTTGHGA